MKHERMCESSVPDWFYHSIADYTDADTDRDHDIKWFLDAVARVVDVAEDGKSFTFKPKAKQKYFERQYHAFLDKACELTGISLDAFVGEAKYDIGMAGMTVTEDRKKQVSFSTTYATGVQVVIVKEGSAIQSPADITTSSKIGVQQDTTGDLYASDTPEKGGWGEAAVTRYKNGADAVQALQTGKLDCVIIDKEPAKSFVAANSGLKILDTEYTNEDYAIAVGKSNTELLEKINKALDELKKDGTIDKIVSKYIPADK